MNKICKAIKSPKLLYAYFDSKISKIYAKILLKISNQAYISFRYKKLFGKKINLKEPQTFAEKIQWMKLYDHDERLVICADKYLVRDLIKEKIGEEYLIPMPFVWDSWKQIDFSSLPDKFVLKPNNSSGRVLICKDKSKLDINSAIKEIKKWEKENLTKRTGEWVYEKIPFKIVCEEYLADDIVDYKMYFADGKFMCTQIIAGRSERAKRFGYFDDKWNLLNIRRYGYKSFVSEAEKPEKYEEMLGIAKTLAQGFKFMRVDLYYVNKKIYFGELSFYPNNGFVRYENEEMDRFFGEKIKLSSQQ